MCNSSLIIEPIIQITTGILALIVQMVYFLKDDREANHTERDRQIKNVWHAAGGTLHCWMGAVIGRQFGWQWGFLMASFNWYLFDGCVNTYVLSREWFYIGETAQLDILQRKLSRLLNIEHRLFSALLKHAVIILSFIFLIHSYK